MPKRHTAYDDVGKIFGNLKVLSVISNKRASNGGFIVLTECIKCGVQEEIRISKLRDGTVSKCCNDRRKVVNNLAGQTFGYLTVLEDDGTRNEYNGAIKWKCKCKCGKIVYRIGQRLLDKEHIHSCGCYEQDIHIKRAEERLIGKKFGSLTPIQVLKETFDSHQFKILCKCDCGNTVIRASSVFNSNYSAQSKCDECFKLERRRDIGEHIGHLIIKDYIQDEEGYLIGYICFCEACNEFKVMDKTEYQNRTRRMKACASCGCTTLGRKSYGELLIKEILDENNISYIHDKAYFKDLKTSETGIGRYDFIIFDENNNPIRLIEYDGIQHYINLKKKYFFTEKDFEETRRRDKIKNEYAKLHNIPLVRIPYTMQHEISYDLLFFHKELEVA